jgi:hypothetical protein
LDVLELYYLYVSFSSHETIFYELNIYHILFLL